MKACVAPLVLVGNMVPIEPKITRISQRWLNPLAQMHGEHPRYRNMALVSGLTAGLRETWGVFMLAAGGRACFEAPSCSSTDSC